MGYIPEYNTHKMLDQFLINFTIVLQALIDTKFIYDDDGDEGNISDSGIFKASKFGRCFFTWRPHFSSTRENFS